MLAINEKDANDIILDYCYITCKIFERSKYLQYGGNFS